MSSLAQLNLMDLIPGSIASDPAVQAAAAALDAHLQQIVTESENLLLYARIDSLEEPVLSHLAYRFKVEFWEDDLPVGKKRDLIKTSIAWHKIKGTPDAIKLVGEIVFGSVDVTEWFDYGGQSQSFKVHTGAVVSEEKQYDRLFRLVDLAKNERSFLDAIVLGKKKQAAVYFGSVVRQSKKYTIKTSSNHKIHDVSRVVGGVIRSSSKVKILPHIFALRINDSKAFAGFAIRTLNKIKIGASDV